MLALILLMFLQTSEPVTIIVPRSQLVSDTPHPEHVVALIVPADVAARFQRGKMTENDKRIMDNAAVLALGAVGRGRPCPETEAAADAADLNRWVRVPGFRACRR